MFEHNEQVELYSLTSDSWKEISYPGVSPDGSPPFNSYVNGFYYWQATGYSGDLILSFDMVNEKFSTLPLPQTLDGFYSHLLDFNGLLGAIVYPGKGTEESFDLWVMNGSWTKQCSIESVPGVEKLLGFRKNGELFIESLDHELVLFDPATRELKNLGIHASKWSMQIIAYVESLVPINGRSEHEEHIIRRPAGGASNCQRWMGNYNKRGRTQAKLKDISGCMEQGMGTKNRGQVTLFLLDLSLRGGAKTTSWPCTHGLHMMPRQKAGPDASMKKTYAWILGSTRNPETYILKDQET
ncbi:hypothetical protein V6N13_064491 [Hibiscus sabdariffa]|uniref:F-box associated beta-propeller type 3 domain-containing protein n=1 Tax=Hibiscus sabdariffa TaxID=183260 RepID=A0ABR2EA81_9ROSI